MDFLIPFVILLWSYLLNILKKALLKDFVAKQIHVLRQFRCPYAIQSTFSFLNFLFYSFQPSRVLSFLLLFQDSYMCFHFLYSLCQNQKFNPYIREGISTSKANRKPKPQTLNFNFTLKLNLYIRGYNLRESNYGADTHSFDLRQNRPFCLS